MYDRLFLHGTSLEPLVKPANTDTKWATAHHLQRSVLYPTSHWALASRSGIAAIAAGLLLIFYPDKSLAMLGNMMGLFWLFSGIALLRRSKDDAIVQMVGGRTSKIIAVVGILTGLLVVTRSLSRQVLPEGALIVLLGVVIMMTGVMHALAEIRVGGATSSSHRVIHLILGIFEIVFGATLILSPLDRSPASYWIATIWALIFGVLVIGDSVAGWSKRHKERDDGGDGSGGDANCSEDDEGTAVGTSTKKLPTDVEPMNEVAVSQPTSPKITAADSDPAPSVEST